MTKADAIKITTQCAKQYKNLYVGNNLLFIARAGSSDFIHLEVSFHEGNFLHLTGLKLSQHISANEFFTRCLSSGLKETDFDFSSDGTTSMKLDILPFLLSNSHMSANMMGNYNFSKQCLFTEKIAGSVRGCVGFVENESRVEYVPNTVLKIDIRDVLKHQYRIIEVYKKSFAESSYCNCVYHCKGYEQIIIHYPIEIRDKLTKQISDNRS